MAIASRQPRQQFAPTWDIPRFERAINSPEGELLNIKQTTAELASHLQGFVGGSTTALSLENSSRR